MDNWCVDLACVFLHTLECFPGSARAPTSAVQRLMYLHVGGRFLFGSNGHIMLCVG
jgi:hypothetical protein